MAGINRVINRVLFKNLEFVKNSLGSVYDWKELINLLHTKREGFTIV